MTVPGETESGPAGTQLDKGYPGRRCTKGASGPWWENPSGAVFFPYHWTPSSCLKKSIRVRGLRPRRTLQPDEPEFSEQDHLLPTIDRINAEQHRIPWLDNRLLVLSVAPTTQPRAGP